MSNQKQVCSKVHFPLVNEQEFNSLEELCNRDFSINISQDVVDNVLRTLADEFTDLIFSLVSVENTEQSSFLERTAQALIDRFDTYLKFKLQT